MRIRLQRTFLSVTPVPMSLTGTAFFSGIQFIVSSEVIFGLIEALNGPQKASKRPHALASRTPPLMDVFLGQRFLEAPGNTAGAARAGSSSLPVFLVRSGIPREVSSLSGSCLSCS